jgi:hypothetical protein
MLELITSASVVSVGTVLITLYTWLLTRNASIYSAFDALYQDILKLGLEHPSYRNPAKTLTYNHSFVGDDLVRYETYAFMVLNVCETIADSLDLYDTSSQRGRAAIARWALRPYALIEWVICRFLPPIADRRRLKRTWEPVLREEARLHGSWIEGREAGVKFKADFLKLMRDMRGPALLRTEPEMLRG